MNMNKNSSVSSLVDELDIVVVPVDSAIGKSLDDEAAGSLTVTVGAGASATVTITWSWAEQELMIAG